MCPVCLTAILAAGATSGGGFWALTRITKEAIGMKTNLKEVKHQIGTRKEWLAARLKLLKVEKEHTRRGDELAVMRQELPWVRVDKDYRFETNEGKASLFDLFRDRSQLLIYHFMFGPDYTAGCPSCSAIADGFNGFQIHLANHDVMLWAVSRAPLAKLQAYEEEQHREGGIEYNYCREDAWKASGPFEQNVWGSGVDKATFLRERPGMSAFVLEDGVVYHTYSTYARGVDALWGMWQWLDRAPKGRNETGHWWHRHDEYDQR